MYANVSAPKAREQAWCDSKRKGSAHSGQATNGPPGSLRQIPHFEAPVPWFLEAESMPGSAATNCVKIERNSVAPVGTNTSVASREKSAIMSFTATNLSRSSQPYICSHALGTQILVPRRDNRIFKIKK